MFRYRCRSGGGGTGHISEITAPVTTDPAQIAEHANRSHFVSKDTPQNNLENGYVVVFTTYQSLDKVCAAQSLSTPLKNLPAADLVVADEAHRTTGAYFDKNLKDKLFQLVHHKLMAHKRLYQTATPRIYSSKSVKKITVGTEEHLQERHIVDMSDFSTYGEVFHNLSFVDALNALESERRLCDYRVIIMRIRRDTPRSHKLDIKNTSFFERIAALGLTLRNAAGVGIDEQSNVVDIKIPNIHSCISFSNVRKNAREAENLLNTEELQNWISKQTSSEELNLEAGYLDGESNAAIRKIELDNLAKAKSEGKHRVTNNVQVLSEGINVPALDAICFLEPRTSEVDIVQAVGRVMRKPSDSTKKFGYIIVPIEMHTNLLFEDALGAWESDWGILGQVLRALRAHDPRIEVDLKKQLIVSANATNSDIDFDIKPFLDQLRSGKFDEIALRLSDECGLQPTVDEDCNLIKDAIGRVAAHFTEERGLGARWQEATGITLAKDEKNEIRACVAATLLLSNALMLHECLVKRDRFSFLRPLSDVIRNERNSSHDQPPVEASIST